MTHALLHSISLSRILKACRLVGLLTLAAFCSSQTSFSAETQPPAPLKVRIKDLNTPREFPTVPSREAWQTRAKEIREQVLVSCGLWPLPEKTPLKARISGKIERDGYSIEKVYFQTYPGFYLAGNLYRPLGKGKGPFPAILNPHGHWKEGRFADNKDGSIAARCISFARQGMIAFSYDMAGFNDTQFRASTADQPYYDIHRRFGTNRTDQLWNISLMGLQTWNSIRALDFLESLPDADRTRLACTGESGGGTQTFILGAIDDRLAVQAPVVMVSHTMQGGCSCENAPGLRVEYSNMEISAAAAPRPQMLVAATGDWTKTTLTVEGPAIEQIYRLLGAPENLRYVRFDFGHNYNQTSREAVYGWFDKWLLKTPADAPCVEAPYQKELDDALRVFPDGKLPDDALTQEQFVEALKKIHQAQWQSLMSKGKGVLDAYKSRFLPAWQHTLQVDWPNNTTQSHSEASTPSGQFTSATLKIARAGQDETLQATYWAPPNILSNPTPKLVVLANSDDDEPAAKLEGLPLKLLERNIAVLKVTHFSSSTAPDQFANFYTTYNRTKLQQRVRDLLALCASASSADPRKPLNFRVILTGNGLAGLWTVLAAPGADAAIANCAGLNVADDEALLEPDLFCPGLRTIGTFQGAAMLAAPHPLLLHNTGTKFPIDKLQAAYRIPNATTRLRVESHALAEEEMVTWIAQLKW